MWTSHFVFLSVPLRFGCLVSDLPVHDWHHLAARVKQRSANWGSGIYLRQEAIENGDIIGFNDREVWGLKNALNLVFNGLKNSQIDPEKLIESKNFNKLLAGM